MRKEYFATILTLAILLVCTSLTNALAGQTINNIRFESPSATVDQIIFELNGPHLPTGKALPGDNPRVYFDFLDTIPSNKVKTRMSANGNFVKQIRYAYHKGENSKTRVVLDLVSNEKMDFKQDFDQDTNTLVITLYLAGTEPDIDAAKPAIEPEPEAVPTSPEVETEVIKESTVPEPPAEDAGKKIQPIEDVSVAVETEPETQMVPPQAEELLPVQTEPEIEEATVEAAKPEPEAKPTPESVASSEPVAEPEATPEPVASAEPVAEPEPTPEPVASSEPVTEPEPTPEPVASAEPVAEPEATPEPVASSKPDTEPEPQEKMPQVTSIAPSTKVPESLETPTGEATVIQPMSEIGLLQREAEVVEDSTPVLHSIEFDPKSNRGEMINFKLNGFHPPVVFGIEEDIPRIVCFFKNASAGSDLKDMIATNGKFVKNIKIGKYKNPDNIRVVLELIPGNNYDLQQIFFKDDKIFMMIINKAGKQISTQSN